jgi:hypothetical protein
MNTDFKAGIDAMLRTKNESNDRDHSYFHPSGFGDCRREIWYKMLGVEPDPGTDHVAKTLRTFDNGHALHLRNQLYARQSGLLSKDKVVSAEDRVYHLGAMEETRRLIIGESGRHYPFELKDQVWVCSEDEFDSNRFKICGFPMPNYAWPRDLKEGDEFWLVEVPIADEEYHIAGHCDAIVITNGEEAVIDYKGTKEASFINCFYDYEDPGRFRSRFDKTWMSCHICGAKMSAPKEFSSHLLEYHSEYGMVSEHYAIQLQLYMWQLNLKSAILWNENKNDQNVLDSAVQRDDKMIDGIRRRAKWLWAKAQGGELPDKPEKHEKAGRNRFPCGWCDYASRCWNE